MGFNRPEDIEEGFPIRMDEARELRLELMEERTVFGRDQGKAFNSIGFNLCEHLFSLCVEDVE